jgi:phosphoglycolate phosphatase
MLKKSYELIVFDWEGTLSDTLGQVVDTINQAAKEIGVNGCEKLRLRHQVQYGVSSAIQGAFPSISDEQYLALEQRFYLLQSKSCNKTLLFDGALALLELLHKQGILLAIASSKGTQSLMQAIKGAQLDTLLDFTRTAQQTCPKPNPKMLNDIMVDARTTNSNTLMIGDSVYDIMMANSIDVDAIGVNFYQGEDEKLLEAGALSVIDDYTKLFDFIELKTKGVK